jgi:23S rRNA (guanosine2251-2'-O)-methyltransferase
LPLYAAAESDKSAAFTEFTLHTTALTHFVFSVAQRAPTSITATGQIVPIHHLCASRASSQFQHFKIMGRNSIKKLARPPRHSSGPTIVYIENEDDLFDLIERTENPLILILEGVQDPQNLGACLRTASGAGVTAVLAPVKGACGITPTVRDISCGGADDVPFLRIKNIGQLLRKFQDRKIQLVGTSDKGKQSLYKVDFDQPTAVILGSEGWGMRKVTGDHCDHLISLPMAGTVDCLNVSVSAGVILYEAVRQRL